MSIPFGLFDHDIIISVLFDCHSIIHIITVKHWVQYVL